MIILDTNVISELMRAAPSVSVVRWCAEQSVVELFTTVVTQSEVLYGIHVLADGKKKTELQEQAEKIFEEDFANRVLAFDGSAAKEFALIASSRRKMGTPISYGDAQIASIARSWAASIATRNVKDFEECGLTLINPWHMLS